MANKSTFTAEIEDAIIEAIRAGESQTAATLASGIRPSTLRSRLHRAKKAKSGKDAAFFDRYEQACAESEQIWVDRFQGVNMEIRIKRDADGNEIERIEITRQRPSDALKVLQQRNPLEYDRAFSDEELIERFRARYGDKWTEQLERLIEAAEQSLE